MNQYQSCGGLFSMQSAIQCDTYCMLFFGKQIYQPQGALNNQAFRQETGMKGTVLVGLHSVTVGNINFRIKAGCTVD